MSTATLTHSGSSVPVSRARVQVPAWGCWWADVDTQDAISIDAGGSVTLTLADKSLTGSVVRGGTVYGRSHYRIVGGAGGWGQSVIVRSYRDDAGVAVAGVLSDLADDVGETLGTLPSTRLGGHYARSAGPASRTLHELAPRAWYVDFDGVTQIGARTSATYEGEATRVSVSPDAGVVELAVDTIGTLVPGAVVDGGAAATDVEYSLTDKRLTVRVYRGTIRSRELDAFARLLDSLDPKRLYRSVYDYRVVTQDGDALNLQPVKASAGMPDLERVPVRLPPGYACEHLLGSLVTVAFLDADPSRPCVVTGDAAGAPGWLPDEITIEAKDSVAIDTGATGSVTVGETSLATELGPAPRLAVARQTDPVICGGFAGTITLGSLKVTSG